MEVIARSDQLKIVKSTLLDQHFQQIGRNPIQVHMMTSVGASFHSGVTPFQGQSQVKSTQNS